MIDERSFARKIVKIHKAMIHMEKHKYLEPFISLQFDGLSEYLRS